MVTVADVQQNVTKAYFNLCPLTSLQQSIEQGGVGEEEKVAKGLGGEGWGQTRLP